MSRHNISFPRQSFLPFSFVLCRDISLKCHNIKYSFSHTVSRRFSLIFSSSYVRHSFLLSRQIFFPSALQLCCDIHYCVVTLFLWFFSTFVTIIFSFFTTEFLIVVCCCRDKYFLCCDIVLLSFTAESELYVATDLENVATYFLP